MRARERASRLHSGLEGSTDVLPPSVSTAARFTLVVQVIEQRQLAKSEECVEVHVYPLPSDHAVAVAKIIYGEPLGYGHRWHISRLDIPVAEAYGRAVEQAEQRGIPFLWINDPHKLFPPSPARSPWRDRKRAMRWALGHPPAACSGAARLFPISSN